jgi:hypothetical protein
MSETFPPSCFRVGDELPCAFALRDARVCRIRRTTEDDAAEFCRFLPQTHAETDFLLFLPGEFNKTVEEEKQWIRERLAKPRTIILLAELDGRIVGAAGRRLLSGEGEGAGRDPPPGRQIESRAIFRTPQTYPNGQAGISASISAINRIVPRSASVIFRYV